MGEFARRTGFIPYTKHSWKEEEFTLLSSFLGVSPQIQLISDILERNCEPSTRSAIRGRRWHLYYRSARLFAGEYWSNGESRKYMETSNCQTNLPLDEGLALIDVRELFDLLSPLPCKSSIFFKDISNKKIQERAFSHRWDGIWVSTYTWEREWVILTPVNPAAVYIRDRISQIQWNPLSAVLTIIYRPFTIAELLFSLHSDKGEKNWILCGSTSRTIARLVDQRVIVGWRKPAKGQLMLSLEGFHCHIQTPIANGQEQSASFEHQVLLSLIQPVVWDGRILLICRRKRALCWEKNMGYKFIGR